MKFCNQCGHALVYKAVEGDTHHRHVCTACEHIHYENPKIIAGCLPIWEDKVLLCTRAIEPRKGYWNLPGGYMEQGETVEEGAIREVWEEASIEARIISLHAVYSIPRISQVYMHFLAELPHLDFAPGVESLEVRLFQEAEIPWRKIAFHSSSFSLRAYFEDLRRGRRQVHLGSI